MYHIFYRPKGQRGSELLSIEDDNARSMWEKMVAGAHRSGSMRHPKLGQEIEFATLQYGGQGGQGGMMCQKWSVEHGLEKIYEPEPASAAEPVVVEAPEQPEPPGIGDMSGVEKYSSEPIPEESVSEIQ